MFVKTPHAWSWIQTGVKSITKPHIYHLATEANYFAKLYKNGTTLNTNRLRARLHTHTHARTGKNNRHTHYFDTVSDNEMKSTYFPNPSLNIEIQFFLFFLKLCRSFLEPRDKDLETTKINERSRPRLTYQGRQIRKTHVLLVILPLSIYRLTRHTPMPRAALFVDMLLRQRKNKWSLRELKSLNG